MLAGSYPQLYGPLATTPLPATGPFLGPRQMVGGIRGGGGTPALSVQQQPGAAGQAGQVASGAAAAGRGLLGGQGGLLNGDNNSLYGLLNLRGGAAEDPAMKAAAGGAEGMKAAGDKYDPTAAGAGMGAGIDSGVLARLSGLLGFLR